MNEEQFRELETVRKELNCKEKKLREEKDFLDRLRSSKTMILGELQEALRTKEHSYLKDKETIDAFDEKHNTSNSNQRNDVIKKLTGKERNTLEKFKRESSRAIEYYEKIIVDLEQELKDNKREYSNLKAYYESQEQPMIVINSKLVRSLEES